MATSLTEFSIEKFLLNINVDVLKKGYVWEKEDVW
jgi:hypothetical protein